MRVPWEAISIRPDPTVLRPARQAAASAGLRPCSAADLRLESTRTIVDQSGNGRLRSRVMFRSVATTECAIPNGMLDVRLVDSAGATLPRDRSSGGPAPTPATLRVRPGQLVFGDMLWSLDAPPATQPAQVAIYPGWDTGDTADAIVISVADVALPAHPRQPPKHADGRTASY